MKKHFLLLLMAFVSLTGWAQGTNLGDGWSIQFGDGGAASDQATYTGEAIVPVVKLVKGVEELTTGFNVSWDADVIRDVRGTGYTVTVTNDMTTTFGDLATPTKKFWVLKATSEINATPEPVLWGGGAYDGADHAVITTAPTFTFGTPLYTIDGGTTWSEEIPTAKKVGVYDVRYKVVGTDNYNGIESTSLGYVVITGTGWVAGDYTAPEAVAGLTFNNTEQPLIAPGSITNAAKNGTMKYKLGADGTWQTNVPTAKNVLAGGYTVYWMIEGGDGFADLTGDDQKVEGILIAAAEPTITAAPAKTGLVYTGLDQALTSAGSATLGATPTYSIKYKETADAAWGDAVPAATIDDVVGKKAGIYQVTTLVAAGGNYLAASENTEVTIAKAPLTITTKAATKVYGAADPAFEAVYTGIKNEESIADLVTAGDFVAPTFTREVGTDVDDYKISITNSAAVIAGAKNYAVTYDADNDQNLTITQKALNNDEFTFTLTSATMEYTGEALQNTIATAKFGEQVLVNPDDYTYVCSNNINVGTANVVISGQGNFKGSLVKTFAITGQAIYIQPTAASKNYGEADPALTAYTLVDGAGAAVDATLNGTVTLARVAGENVGQYKIYVVSYEADAANPDNYTPGNIYNLPNSGDAKNKTALFTINPAGEGLVLKFKEGTTATKVYGDENPVWSIDDLEYVSGKVGDDTWEIIKPTLSAPVFAIASEDVDDNATNKVIVTGLASANYPTVTVQAMDFTITKRPITVTVENQAITYGAALAPATYGTNWSIAAATPLVAGDDAAGLGLTLKTVNDLYTYGVAADAYEDAITAEITNNNYDLTVENGNLTVSAGAAITFTTTGDMDALISAYEGQEIAVSLNRALTRAETWYAMVLPFETTVAELSQKYGYAVVNVLNETNDDASKVKFKLHMQTINANQPFLIKIATAQAADAAPINFGDKPIVYAEDPISKDIAGNEFHGIFKSTNLEASNYLWVMIPSQNKFMKLDQSGTTLNPTLAYLKTKENLDAFAPVITVEDFDFNTGTTSIKVLNAETMKAYSTDGWYNLNGVKLQGVPTEKGVYIQNGKKVIIK